MTIAAGIYLMCALTSLGCTFLLVRSWRLHRHRIVFWSAMCFALLTLNNVLLVLDKLVFAQIDLSLWRQAAALLAMLLLVGALVLEE